ncbi:transcriptional regulator [Pantoea ananatis]|uniref:response regulator transcription factor n=1 Tax=Pantoea ananas TaxID=553 RepID=UPI0007361ED3|nr:response regulator transcription factor [Pantoea ananatis]KTR47868.1 transcriptional regulator [Pantoea ananatis]KTR53057.1 transcriptional regulator [Pantoea ananatis]KTR63947.1 transcriptional regulator [Pantoea ananatis]KTR70164.1 transcriptional regulator [Pantoea ananatis]PZD58587.1 DNA-binding response regulator [Pantoea ananatis]
MKILLVEDEPEMAAVLAEALGHHHFLTDHAATLAEASEAIAQYSYDVVLLDRQLPGGDGIELIRSMRAAGKTYPVLVLSARGDISDKILGLDEGADDYLAKPFDFSELLARIRALIRRPSALQDDVVTVGALTFDHIHCEASVNGAIMRLTRRETLLLDSMVRRFGRVVSRETLMSSVFSFNDQVQPNALDLHISRLRQKLTEAESGLKINVVRGVGYFMNEES